MGDFHRERCKTESLLLISWPYHERLGISFNEITESMDCCITGFRHPINKNISL